MNSNKEEKKQKQKKVAKMELKPWNLADDVLFGITRGRDAPVGTDVFRQWNGGKHRPGRQMAAIHFGSAGSPPWGTEPG